MLDRLASRLGRAAVVEPQLLADAQPEAAWAAVPVAGVVGLMATVRPDVSPERIREVLNESVDVLPSLSRLMQRGIGEGRTREDHRDVANALYARYARGRDLRRLEAMLLLARVAA